MNKSFLDRYRERKGKPIDASPITLTIQILNLLKYMLQGKKTYITGTIAILGAIAGYLTKDLSLAAALAGIFAALQTMNIRSAITTENAK